MAAIIARRLSSRLQNPFHSSSSSSSSLSLISTNNLIFKEPQVPILKPFSPFNPLFSSTRNFSVSRSSVSSGISQDAPQCPDLRHRQFVSSMNPFISRSSVTRPKFLSTNDLSSESEKPQQNPDPNLGPNPNFTHQEAEEPSFERDPSSVANETREVLEGMIKNMCSLSKALGVVSVLQLGFGAWIAYITQSSPIAEVSIQSFLAFAFPLSSAFLLRRSLKLKPMYFFMKMGEQGGDFSSVAKESREVRDWLIKSTESLAMAVAAWNLVQLGLGAWIAEITWSSPIREVSMQSFLAFAFPFSLLFMLYQSLKPKHSLKKKMGEQGRALHFARQLDLFFVRSRGVSFICIAGLSAGLLFAAFSG